MWMFYFINSDINGSEFIVIIKQNSILSKKKVQPMYDQEEWEDDFEFEDSAANKNKNVKTDKFQQFEADRKILKKQDKKMSDSINFGKSLSKSKSKPKGKKEQRYDQEGDYGDDFEGDEDKHKTPLKNSFQKNNSSSFDNKLKKNKTDKKLNRSPTEKKKISKSSLSAQKQEDSKGRYMQEVQKKFYQHNNPSNLSNDAINRVNTQIRQTIKKYNDILSELITKNLNNYIQAKNKKSHTVDDEIKVLQEEIKNNQKLQERIGHQLKTLHSNVQKMQQKQEYSDRGIEEEIAEARKQIKKKKKSLHEKKLQVEHQGKKLVGGRNTFKPETSGEKNSDVTIIKEKLLIARRQFDKNEQRIQELEKRENGLSQKIGSIEGKEKQADQIITVTKKKQQKSKKYEEIRKKLQNSKNHTNKTKSLWHTKYGVIEHENQAIRQKIKNIELEVKNLEESISSVYEKTQKTLQNPKLRKTEDGLEKKILLDKLVDDMKVYDPNMKKEQSTTQMKLFQNKKSSVNLSDNSRMGGEEEYRKNEEEKGNRVWRQQKQEKWQKTEIEMVKQDSLKKKKETQEQKPSLASERYEDRPKIAEKNQERFSLHQENEGEGDQKENKPKKFNFKKNRQSSEVKLSELQEKIDEAKDPNSHENEFIKETEVHKPSLNSQQQNGKMNEQNDTADKPFVPKRFNLRAKKNTDQVYMPSGQEQPQSSTIEKKPTNEDEGGKKEIENSEASRPMFKLKRKNRQSVEAMQNQFIS